MHVAKLLFISPMLATGLAQLSQPISPGILSLLTPAVQVSTIKPEDISTLSSHVTSFYSSYTAADSFNFTRVLTDYERSALRDGANTVTLLANLGTLGFEYLEYWTSLVESPDRYLSTLHSDVAFLPTSIQSQILSQMTNLLSGFESLATKDVLHQTPTAASVTPGASVSVGFPSPTAANSSAAGSPRLPTVQPTSATAEAAHAVTMPAQLLAAAAVGAVGAVGAALL